MKRTLLLLLVLLTLLPFAACGEPESEYKYDMIDELFYDSFDLELSRSIPIRGGSIVLMDLSWLRGEDYPLYGGKNYVPTYLVTLFNEESKLMFPLCYDPTCTHEDDGCFASNLNLTAWPCFVANDRIYNLVGTSPVCVDVYSTDGALEKSIEFDAGQLVNRDGSTPYYYMGNSSYYICNRKVYMDFVGYDCQREIDRWNTGETSELNRWIVSFDLNTLEFEVVCNYLVPDPYGSGGMSVSFVENTDTQLGAVYDDRYAYVFDLAKGTYTETDCAALFDQMLANGTLKSGQIIDTVYPLRKIMFITGSKDWEYVSMESGEKIELTAVEKCKLRSKYEFVYDGDIYYYDERANGAEFTFIREDDKKTVDVSPVFADGKYRMSKNYGYICAEDGLIALYVNAEETDDGERYTVTEGKEEVTYQKARRYFYVTYEDMLDGTIDTPFYYDPDTGVFSEAS